jgi:hypothetical protein
MTHRLQDQPSLSFCIAHVINLVNGYFVSGVTGSGSTGGSGCTGGKGVSGTLEGGVSISGLLGPGVVSRLFGWML